MDSFYDSVYQLIVQTSTNLPSDVRRAIVRATALETGGSQSGLALATINQNVDLATDLVSPICQDTGMPTFEIHTPVGTNQIAMKAEIRRAISDATKAGKLRPNSVDSLTGQNSGDNLGPGTPVMHFEQWAQNEIEIKLILKGGGCENKNIQYALPAELPGVGKAGRDLDGVRKCILHAVYQAQGQGCSAGFIGVAVGGDRTSGYTAAKQQLFRDLDDVNPNPELAELEAYVLDKANTLEIGTMGFGGRVTLMGCKIGALNRLPASFYVSVAYNCWAYRRLGVVLDPETGAIRRWLYRDETEPRRMAAESGIPTTGREVHLQTPVSEAQVRELRVGDVVVLSGPMVTGRDALHKHLMSHDSPVDLAGAALYHCGPVMLKDADGIWHVKAAGPTTSIREEPYQADILKKFGVRLVIGKGGMGPKTLAGLAESGAVYLNAIGGAAQVYAQAITGVSGVHFLDEFGIPEAMWQLDTDGFAAIVTMDSHGNSLHAEVDQASKNRLTQLADPVF